MPDICSTFTILTECFEEYQSKIAYYCFEHEEYIYVQNEIQRSDQAPADSVLSRLTQYLMHTYRVYLC